MTTISRRRFPLPPLGGERSFLPAFFFLFGLLALM
jgi:hypothetical protein